MQFKYKKIGAVILASIISISIVGCGNKKETSNMTEEEIAMMNAAIDNIKIDQEIKTEKENAAEQERVNQEHEKEMEQHHKELVEEQENKKLNAFNKRKITEAAMMIDGDIYEMPTSYGHMIEKGWIFNESHRPNNIYKELSFDKDNPTMVDPYSGIHVDINRDDFKVDGKYKVQFMVFFMNETEEPISIRDCKIYGLTAYLINRSGLDLVPEIRLPKNITMQSSVDEIKEALGEGISLGKNSSTLRYKNEGKKTGSVSIGHLNNRPDSFSITAYLPIETIYAQDIK